MKRSFLALIVACAASFAGAAESYKIAVVPKGTTHEFWKAINAGAMKAAQELKAEALALQAVTDTLTNPHDYMIAATEASLNTQMTALYNRYISQFTAMQDILNSSKTDGNSLTSMMTAWTAGLKQ